MYKLKYSKILILGSGPAGYTNSIYVYRSNFNPILITGNQLGGQLTSTDKIENWPGLINPISGFNLMNNFFLQLKRLGLEIIFDKIFNTNLLLKPLILYSFYINYFCEVLIVATGVKFKKLSVFNNRKYLDNVSMCAVCDGNFYKKKKIIVIGGGNSAIENIIYLNKIVNEIILIHRKNILKSELILMKNFFLNKIKKNFSLKLNTVIYNIIGDKHFIKYIKTKNLINGIFNIIFTDGIFLSIGGIPNTYIFNSQLFLINDYIHIKKDSFYNYSSTSISGVFACGDVEDYFYKQAITSSGFGCISAFDSINFYNNIIS